MRMVMLVMGMFMRMAVIVFMIMRMAVIMMLMITVFMIVMFGIDALMFAILRVGMILFGVLVSFVRLGGLRGVGARMFDDLALDPLAAAAAARVAVARTAAAMVGAVFGFFLGLAMGAFVRLDQGLTVGYRDLIIVGMDFAEGEEAVAVAAILDEGRLQRRLNTRDLGEIDISAQLFALGGLEIKLFDAIAADHDNPGLLRVGSIDQHFVGHFGTHDGGGRV